MHDRWERVCAGPAAALVLGVLWLFSAMEAAGAPCTLGEPKSWIPHPHSVCQGDSYEVTSEPKYSPEGCELVRGRSITYRCTLSLDPSGCAWDSAREVFTADLLTGTRDCSCKRWDAGSWSPKLKPEEVCQGDTVPEQIQEYTLYPPGCRNLAGLPKPFAASARMVTGTHACEDTRPRKLTWKQDWCKFADSNRGDYRLALLFSDPATDAATETEPCRIMSQRYGAEGTDEYNLIYLMWLHADPAGEDYDKGRGGFPVNLPYTSSTRFEYWRDLLRSGGYGDWCLFDTCACGSGPPSSYGAPPGDLCPLSSGYYPNPLPQCIPQSPISCSGAVTSDGGITYEAKGSTWPQPKNSPTTREVGVCGTEDRTCTVGVPQHFYTGSWACHGPNDGGTVNCTLP